MRLLPSLRQKKRYVAFEILAEKKFSFNDIKAEVQNSLQQFLGYQGMAQASPLILAERFNQPKQRFVVKVSNILVDELKAALLFCTQINKTPIIIRSLITSGTLKKAGLFLEK